MLPKFFAGLFPCFLVIGYPILVFQFKTMPMRFKILFIVSAELVFIISCNFFGLPLPRTQTVVMTPLFAFLVTVIGYTRYLHRRQKIAAAEAQKENTAATAAVLPGVEPSAGKNKRK